MIVNLEERLNNGEGPSQRRDNDGHNGANTGGTYGRLTKIEFLKFDGEDVLSWLYRVNNFFDMDNIVEDEQKIRLVSMHMFGKALSWHQHFMCKFGEVMTWPVYQTHVKKRFESVFEDPIMELKNLKHTTSVQVPEKILDRRIGKVNNRATVYVLVKWINQSEEDATWELAEDLSKRFLEFSLDH
nr:hypothetical protein [Tanacetum cinerariifolium]